MTSRTFGRIAGLFFLFLLLFGSACQAQTRGTPKWRVGVEYLSGLYGVAFCRDAGSFYLVKGGLSAIDRASTDAHEAMHITQHGRYPNCAAFYKWYDTPVGRLEIEAEAFAAGWCVAVAMGADSVSTRQQHLRSLIMFYVPGTQIYEAASAFARYAKCP